ncbi:minor tail protein [Streptomyces phage Yosif]|uniref:Minor tail protein n=1 Tax=Streptomyces phage Yosif TaxID=2201421 RepID=A0A2Z4QBV2_9CAUD|nr:minor tail protein [Streptomyces phage Yosif]AWY07587.1 minor tail protein [Streptomyces phage Yosif]
MGLNVIPAPEVSGFTGAPGPQGLKGDKGDTGATGATGARGATGVAGADGARMWTGTDEPASTLGADGDVYFRREVVNFLGQDSTTLTMYIKANGTWFLDTANVRGAMWYTNNTSTASTSTKPGDMLLRTDTGDIWQRTASGWGTSIGNLKGPKGDKGDTGATGAAGPAGPAGGIPLTGEVTGVNVAMKGDGTKNIQEWKNSSGSIAARIGANGNIVAQGAMYAVNGVQVGSTSTDFGGGAGAILGIDDAVTVPSTNPTAGVILYSEGGALKYRKPDGTVVTVGQGGELAKSPTFDDFMIINATADTNYGIVAMRKLNKKRWMFAVSGASETGGNTGSNFMLQSYNDDETDGTVHIYGDRETGNTTIGGTTEMNGARLNVQGGAIGVQNQSADPTSSSLGIHLYAKSGRPYMRRGSGASPGGALAFEVQPRPDEWLPEDLGLKAWTTDPSNCVSYGAYCGSGPVRVAAVNLRQAQTITKIAWHFLGYAGGLQAGSWAAIYNSSGTRVAATGDLSTAAYEPAEQHGSGGGTSTSPLTASYAAPVGLYYVAWRFVYNTTTGDGPMCLQYENSAGAPPNVFGVTPVKRFGYFGASSATGQSTAAPSTIPLSSMENGANRFWAALA